MTDEVNAPAVPTADNPAPATEETANSVVETHAKPDEETVPKTFTQKELEAEIGKRLDRQHRKLEREYQQRLHEAAQANTVQPEQLKQEQFNSPEEYAKALAVPMAKELLARQEQEKAALEARSAYQDREEEARSKYQDYEQVAYNPRIPITDLMAQAIQLSEIGPDVAYFLGANPKEAHRIANLAPVAQAKEIGKLEARLMATPIQTKQVSNTPPPISPVKARSTANPSYDTTDPRSIKTMSTSEWIEAERERQRRKWEGRHRS